jgi:hypothetical protein
MVMQSYVVSVPLLSVKFKLRRSDDLQANYEYQRGDKFRSPVLAIVHPANRAAGRAPVFMILAMDSDGVLIIMAFDFDS